jgi:hypothetical protein
VLVAITIISLAATACASGDDGGADAAATSTTEAAPDVAPLPDDVVGYSSDQYGDGKNWLCHPDDADENVCDRDLTATVVALDGTTEIEEHAQAEDPAIDCFYVYPTISADPGLNSDLEPHESQEIRTVVNQVARLSSVCEVYAPVYRQMTVGSLLQRFGGDSDQAAMDAARDTTYGDVRDAFRHYMANDNDGRGVILVGHSQGAGLLTELITQEIDGNDAYTDRLVSAFLLGTSLPAGEDDEPGTTAAFESIPLCEAVDQIGCVVTYASYPASEPPADDALFGATQDPPGVAACTNPAALGGGSATLTPYFTSAEGSALAPGATVDTPWVSVSGALTAECVLRNGRLVLEVTLLDDPTDVRDRELRGGLPANWGLHLADANLAMGDLEALAASQAAAYTAR